MLGAIAFREWGEARGLRPDQIVVSEPTRCCPIYGHKGGAGYEVAVRGEAAHSSRPELGCSAIVAAARAVLALQDEHDRLQTEPPLTEVGVGSINVGLISGGTAGNIVPDLCTFTVGRRVCPGEDPEAVAAALRTLIEEAVRPAPPRSRRSAPACRRPASTSRPTPPWSARWPRPPGRPPPSPPTARTRCATSASPRSSWCSDPAASTTPTRPGSAWRSASSNAAPPPSRPGCARA